MSRSQHRIVLLALALSLTVPARADDGNRRTRSHRAETAAAGQAQTTEAPRHYDYSRYSNGPRRVPRPRGASQRRAESLGLGTERVGHRLLIAAPEARWVEAAGGTRAPSALTWPVENGRFGRGFGFVRHTRPDLRHDGVDIVAEEGSVVRAAADGIVAYSDNGIRGYGNVVILIHPGGWVTLYAHTYRTTVQPGWRVHAGERIAFVGSTGISHGPHVHFELHVRGRAVDPLRRFEGRPWIAAYRDLVERRRRGDTFAPTDHLSVGRRHQRAPRAGEPRESHASAAATATTAIERPADEEAPPNLTVSASALRRLLRRGARDSVLAQVSGRHFRTALWPARGGQLERVRRGRFQVSAEANTPARATADGVVIFVGARRHVAGTSLAILHPNGWVSLYSGLDEAALEAGDEVQRGAWLGRFGSHNLGFELWKSGRRVDVAPLLVGAPQP